MASKANDKKIDEIMMALMDDIPDVSSGKNKNEDIAREKNKKVVNENVLVKNVNNKVLIDILSQKLAIMKRLREFISQYL